LGVVVSSCAPSGQDLQADAAPGQVMDETDQVAQVAAERIEFPCHQRVALPQRLEACLQTRPIVTLTGRVVLVEVPRFDAGSKERVALQIERLAAIGLRDAHVADPHGMLHKRANT
jgi:hypothetical protein